MSGSLLRGRKPPDMFKDEQGSTLVEFAMSASIFFVVLFFSIYTCYFVYVAHYVTDAASDGARYAAVRGASWSGQACRENSSASCVASAANVASYVQSRMPPGMIPDAMTVTTSWPGTTTTGATCDTNDGANGSNCSVLVTVTYGFNVSMPFLQHRTIPLSAASAMSIVD